MGAGTRSGFAHCISQHLALGAVDKYLNESMNKMKTEAKIIAWKKKYSNLIDKHGMVETGRRKGWGESGGFD